MSLQDFAHNNKFLMLALDQLGSFFKMIDADPGKDKLRVIEMKRKILEPLRDKFSGVLLDSIFGLPAYRKVIREQGIKNPQPFLLRIEETGYDTVGEERITPLKYSAKELQEQGASGVKLLLYLNPKVGSFTKQITVALKVQKQAREQEMPYFLEALLYDTPQNPAPTTGYLATTLEKLIERGVKPDVWKLPFPGNLKLASEISKIIGNTPWVLLSHGTPFEQFKIDLEVSVKGGASGFLAGRALWQEVGNYSNEEQEKFLWVTLPKRFDELVQRVGL